MQKKSLKEYVQKESAGAWVGSMEVMLNEMAIDVRNLKQQVDKLMKWKEFEDRERRNHLLNAKDIDSKWLCGKCDQQKMREEGILGKDVEEFPDHFRTCEKRKEEKPRWRPEHRGTHFFIDNDGQVEEEKFDAETACFQDVWKFGNSFPTHEAAEHAASEIKKLLKSLHGNS